MLAGPGDGFKVAMASLDVFRSTVAAAALGFARRALDEALARSRSRIAFGKPIAETQLIQEKIADMAVKIDAAALLTYRSAWTKDTFKGRVTREAAIAKLYATEAAQEVIDQAVQVFGGQGVIVGNPVETPLPRDPRAPHLRGHQRDPEADRRRTDAGGELRQTGKYVRDRTSGLPGRTLLGRGLRDEATAKFAPATPRLPGRGCRPCPPPGPCAIPPCSPAA